MGERGARLRERSRAGGAGLAWGGGKRSKPQRQGCGRDKTEASPEGERALAKIGEKW